MSLKQRINSVEETREGRDCRIEKGICIRLDTPIDEGVGNPLVLLHGFGMRPATYRTLADLLAERCRVIVPDLFDVRGSWRYAEVVDALIATLDDLELDQVSLLGHSFGGAIELGVASLLPQRIVELVFSDTLAVSCEWVLSREALHHPTRLLRLATPLAARSFAETWVRHPRQLVEAAWWAFRSEREGDIENVAQAGIPTHVLWANRDSVLSRSDGMRFADELGASFAVARGAGSRPIDHDWMFQEPSLFFDHLQDLGLKALA